LINPQQQHFNLSLYMLSMQVNDYPTLLLYPATDKSNPVCHTETNEKKNEYVILFATVIDRGVALSFGMQIKLSKKSSAKALARQIKEKLQISDVESVAAADVVKDEL
jgi:hypothetical protein